MTDRRCDCGDSPAKLTLARLSEGAAPRAEGHTHNPDACDHCMALVMIGADRAAPRAEGLDVERLAEWFHDKWESQGIACWHKNQHMRSWDCGRDAIEAVEYARLSRPSDERVPESEEAR